MEPTNQPPTQPPVQPTVAPQPPQSSPQAPLPPNPAPTGPNKGLIIGLIVGGAVLLIGGIIAAIMLFANSQTPKVEVSQRQSSNNSSTEEVAEASPCITKAESEQIWGLQLTSFAPDQTLFKQDYYFKADTASPEYDSIAAKDLDTLATWVNAYDDKKFTIDLTPRVREAGLSGPGADLATARANFIQQQLIDRGVSQDKIVIKPATASTRPQAEDETFLRNVNLIVKGDASCAE